MNRAACNDPSLVLAPEVRQETSDGPDFLNRCRDGFSETRDTRFFHGGECAAAALEALLAFVNGADGGVAMVVSEPGCGKSMLRTELHRRLAAEGHACVALENGWLDFDGIVLEIISQLQSTRVEAATLPDRYSRLAALKQALLQHVVRPGRRLAILFDEAQQLEEAALEGIRSLTNINAECENYLFPVLFGQPELARRIAARPQFESRITVRRLLQPMSLEATANYVEHRIRTATGGDPAPFTPEALRKLHALTDGVPRLVNQRCKMALETCIRRQIALVDAEILEIRPPEPASKRSWPDSCLLTGHE